ncbi:MAG: hypothetical protein WA485_08980 [Candidatus Sulfotelmatobacter sp.]
MNDQLTIIVAALLHSTSYSAVSAPVIKQIVDQGEAICAEINKRFKGADCGSIQPSV